jgi:small subunit ribosomal protein S6
MTKKIYESAVLINAALEDEQIQSVIERIKEILSSNDGEIKEIEDWGRKRLAYSIKKSKIGYYVIFRFLAYPEIISVLERFYKLDENILRYLTIKLSQIAFEQIEKNNKPQESVETESQDGDVVEESAAKSESEDETNDSTEIEQNS